MKMPSDAYTKATDFIGKVVTVTVDRSLGSKHPKFDWTYPLNYGFIKETRSPDGEELDAYILEIDTPVEQHTGTCVAVIHRTDDDDDKLIVVPQGSRSLTDKEIRTATHFQEQYFDSEIINNLTHRPIKA
jgi:inorganic pyrophosphatase